MKTVRQRRNGFTLIEILTVLGIIIILGALSFAVFARVREKGRSATCQSNLKQIALAMQQYVQDNDGGYPIFLAVAPNRFATWSDHLRLYTKSNDVFYCPSYPFVQQHGGIVMTGNTSYDLNIIRISYWQDNIGHAPKKETETEQLLNPSVTWLNLCPDMRIENASILTSDKVFYSSCGRKIGLNIGEHHSGGTNWSFLDGHVKWMTNQQLADLDCGNPPLPPNFTPK